MNSDVLRDIEDYLRNEHQYYIDYPELFKLFPDKQKQRRRGDNTIAGLYSKLRTFITWAMKRNKSIIDPFDDYIPVKEKYGTPFYLTVDERNQIYKHDFSSKPHLEIKRDIFIFQCAFDDLQKLKLDTLMPAIQATHQWYKTRLP